MTDTQQTFNDELRGALFQNDKGDNPARPDYRGRCVVEGKAFRISGWKRKAQATGKVYLSLAFTLDPTAEAQTAAPAATPAAPPDDDLPF
jgi:uncharacterized protein (DUF736 family)